MARNQTSTTLIPPKKNIFPPAPDFNPAITPPFSKPSLESVTSTLQPTPSEQETAAPAGKDYDPNSSNPFSAFYSHPTTRTSLEQWKSESKSHIKSYDQDLEEGSGTTQAPSKADAPNALKKECTMWPSRNTQIKTKINLAGTVRGSRACAPYRRLSKKQKLCIQILLAIFIVGAATGLGIGISKAVGSGVWSSHHS